MIGPLFPSFLPPPPPPPPSLPLPVPPSPVLSATLPPLWPLDSYSLCLSSLYCWRTSPLCGLLIPIAYSVSLCIVGDPPPAVGSSYSVYLSSLYCRRSYPPSGLLTRIASACPLYCRRSCPFCGLLILISSACPLCIVSDPVLSVLSAILSPLWPLDSYSLCLSFLYCR